ncbi:uncharacterized protein GVI51_K09889 [Nakaseomyces glabratus]|uniref:HTH CENPB-type domain-containing protein n=2 Tax=Candida glabrata TaxID=5478 RepID=Q6FM88_CANGA|nr:uncharacterized protein CAGL0K10054g [Nakaseomyces glabratus]KAH7582432.1 CENPB-type HTH domain profile [Nakaseomyces glabratus]KAH7584763.1 CENPB-type HTH domain profile [Nakaseomyces glabratus]KAH7597222.1 CENPB-type HTH domain profile [Nakaseomyces glabratus]KAH7602994.1 CENPB-type HTH domain profile [Nakaseomyces glabratus]KAI8394796.1 CENPB-type HTH domain profile [Nakaseomyces glabratus]|eukprot:XP_448656.1 uncharacterized protein CAGL0K10054g [[Candida] glabrata]
MLSIEQRYNICLMAERHPRWTQLELAKWAYDTFQLDKVPSQGTISRLLSRKSTYMNCKEHERDATRLRTPNNLLVRRIIQEWISQSLWNGIPITSPIIQETAHSVWQRIPPEFREGNGSFSYKWITNFLAKMDVNISALDEELPKTPKVWTFEERSALKDLFAKVPPKDLFTLDETFIAYNLPLDYAQYEASRIQRKIEVATVMLCSNLDGSEKIKPMVVGRYNSYKSFRNYFPSEPIDPVSQSMLGQKMAEKFNVTYHSNRKSWLTSNLFHNWLAQWDKRLGAYNRKIWIVLDDSCSHRIVNVHLKNINLVYTSANSRFLPFNWGVLDEFKTRYRIQQYQALIELQRRLESKLKSKEILISFEQSQLTMSNAFKFISRAWSDIPVDTIKANWKSSGLLPNDMIKLNETVSMAFKKNEALEAKLEKLCNEYHCEKKWDYEMLLDLNIENKNTNFLSTEELVESAIIENYEPDGVDNDAQPSTNEFNAQLPESENTKQFIEGQNGYTHLESRKNSLNIGDPKSNYNSDFLNLITSGYHANQNSTSSNNDAFTQTNIFDVSTLIDKSNIFMDANDDNIDFNNVNVDLPLGNEEYLNDLFPQSIDVSHTTTKPIDIHDNSAIIEQTFDDLTTGKTDRTNSVEHDDSTNQLDNNVQQILDFYGTSPESHTSSNGLKSVQTSDSSSPLDTIQEGNSLKTDIEIASSLQVLLKHINHNTLKFNKRTVKQLSNTYQELVKKVKKNQNQQKQKPEQFKFEDIFFNNSNSDNPTTNESNYDLALEKTNGGTSQFQVKEVDPFF